MHIVKLKQNLKEYIVRLITSGIIKLGVLNCQAIVRSSQDNSNKNVILRESIKYNGQD